MDTHEFTARNLTKVGYASNPLEDGSLTDFALHALDLTGMTVESVKEFGLSRKDAARAKNMYALGLVSWLYGRDVEGTVSYLMAKFAKVPDIRDANVTALKSGWFFGETTETFAVSYTVKSSPAARAAIATSWATPPSPTGWLPRAAQRAPGSSSAPTRSRRPATSSTSCASYKNFDVLTFQAEDEIAAMAPTIGAAFAGAMAVTSTRGPGIALKAEAIGLAVMTELPMLVINVQRGGPSTGLPTKTEQADLLQAMYGRNGEARCR